MRGPVSERLHRDHPTTLVVHDTESVDDLLVRGASSVAWLLRGMSIRVGRSQNRQANLMTTDVRARLSRLLLDWCAVGDTAHVPGPFQGGLAQSVLAEVIGSTRHTVNRTLRSFEHRGFVVLEHGGITVEDFDAVTRLARKAKPYFAGVGLHSQDSAPDGTAHDWCDADLSASREAAVAPQGRGP